MRWYADNSELYSTWDTELPDVLLFGGIAVPWHQESTLSDGFVAIKTQYSKDVSFPLKWNFKDLRKWFEDKDELDLFNQLLKDSKKWRKRAFHLLAGTDVKLILACLVSYGKKRGTIKKTKQKCTGYVFSDGLMRLGMLAKETDDERWEVVLDWPDKADRRPFDDEYETAYWSGTNADQHVTYICGPLKNHAFLDAPFYASMNNCALLQLSDLVVGASKDFLEVAIGKRDDAFGVDMLRIVVHKFRGFPDRILSYGLSVAPASDTEFCDKIKKAIADMLLKDT